MTMEIAEALALHDRTNEQYQQALRDLTEAQWSFRPAPGRWTIQEVAEHVVLVDDILRAGVEKTMAREEDPQWSEKAGALSESVQARVLDRAAIRIEAPPRVQPGGQWSIVETLQRFQEARLRTRALLAQADARMLTHTFTARPGTYNCFDWLKFASLHHQRHFAQIAEVKLDPSYPV